MTRYRAMFDRCSAANAAAFGGFLMLGDPGLEQSAANLDALAEGGADMIEVGIPFSDPVADGPVIQAAAERALRAGVRTADCLRLIAGFREKHPDIPVGVLTYANIVAAKGIGRFCNALAGAGADSLLVADVPSLEAAPYAEAARNAGIDLVMIAANNTARPALERIARLSSGYTYCVARAGVTGADVAPTIDHGALFHALADAGAPPPVLGFGISKPEQVRMAVASGAAGVISGSAIVSRIASGESPTEVARFVATLKAASRRDPHCGPAENAGFVHLGAS